MFGIGFFEVVLILLIALVFLPPSDYPALLRLIGSLTGRIQRFRANLEQEISELKRAAEKTTETIQKKTPTRWLSRPGDSPVPAPPGEARRDLAATGASLRRPLTAPVLPADTPANQGRSIVPAVPNPPAPSERKPSAPAQETTKVFPDTRQQRLFTPPTEEEK